MQDIGVCMCVYLCMCVCMCVCLCVCACVCACVCTIYMRMKCMYMHVVNLYYLTSVIKLYIYALCS